jgi:hypothetical protein
MKTNKTVYIYIAALLAFSVFITSCATMPPLGPNEARVTGHKATLMNAVTVYVALADNTNSTFRPQIIIPAGRNHLAIRYGATSFDLVTAVVNEGIARKNVKVVEFDAEAGHEYYAEMTGISIFDIGFRVTDKTTEKVVADTKAQKHQNEMPPPKKQAE